jgi:hypothetical protein
MKGRGIDFEHRFRTSRWAEDLLLKSINGRRELFAARFGLSEIRSSDKLIYGLDPHKEPDLLILDRRRLDAKELRILEATDFVQAERALFNAGGSLRFAIEKAVAAIEVEFSPYRAKEMKGRNWKPKSEEAWNKRPLKHANPPTAPNIWVKEEDLGKLLGWQNALGVHIVVAHVFDQEAFAVSLNAIASFNETLIANLRNSNKLQMTRGIFKKVQAYDRVDAQGAGEKKTVFVVTPFVATKVGDIQNVNVHAQLGVSASKKYVTHPVFSDGEFVISDEFVNLLLTPTA